MTAAIRPEEIGIGTKEMPGAFAGEVYAALPAGSETIVQVRWEGRIFHVRVMGETSLDIGERVFLHFTPESVGYFHGEGGARIDAG